MFTYGILNKQTFFWHSAIWPHKRISMNRYMLDRLQLARMQVNAQRLTQLAWTSHCQFFYLKFKKKLINTSGVLEYVCSRHQFELQNLRFQYSKKTADVVFALSVSCNVNFATQPPSANIKKRIIEHCAKHQATEEANKLFNTVPLPTQSKLFLLVF